MYHDILNKILLLPKEEDAIAKIEEWLTDNEIEFRTTSHLQYKILNGCIKNIMFYPSRHKLMIQCDGRNYIQTATAETIISVIKGNISFREEQ